MNTLPKLTQETQKIIHYNFNKKTGASLQHTAVDPIKSKEDIIAGQKYLLTKKQRYFNSNLNIRDYTLFVLMLNTGRRISDVLRLTIGDVSKPSKPDKTIRDFIDIREKKTGKASGKIFFNETVKKALSAYLETLDNPQPNDYLFQSRKGSNNPITRQQAWRIFKDMADKIGLTEKGITVGCHSPRKTMGYHIVKDHKDDATIINSVQKIFNHSDQKVTMAYIGIQDEEMKEFFFGLDSLNYQL